MHPQASPSPLAVDQPLALEATYLTSSDPLHQSGYRGGLERWRAERSPILDAVDKDGDILDIGCANGYLLESLVAWAAGRGIALQAHGIDIGPRLIDLARKRLPHRAGQLHTGDALSWQPSEGQRYDYIYAVHDIIPPRSLAAFLAHCMRSLARPRARVILGAYSTEAHPAAEIAAILRSHGFLVAGESACEPHARYAWLTAPA